jgi:hypothetical protein
MPDEHSRLVVWGDNGQAGGLGSVEWGWGEIRRDVLLSAFCEADCPAGSPPRPHSPTHKQQWQAAKRSSNPF